MYLPIAKKRKKSRVLGPSPKLDYPCGFFDGASAKNIGGTGFFLYLNESHSFEFVVGVGLCTNTKAELVGLWALLLSTQMMGFPHLGFLVTPQSSSTGQRVMLPFLHLNSILGVGKLESFAHTF